MDHPKAFVILSGNDMACFEIRRRLRDTNFFGPVDTGPGNRLTAVAGQNPLKVNSDESLS